MDPGQSFNQWRTSLQGLTRDSVELGKWQDRRYAFAHKVGSMLTQPLGSVPAVRGHVLYGVYLAGVGLAYVGQSTEAERRLRDLTVGESHHLAVTVPPELWERVVVVSWPSLLDGLPAQERALVMEIGETACGKALEYKIQLDVHPFLNTRRRMTGGGWRDRRLEASRSVAATHSISLPELHRRVWAVWMRLEQRQPPADGSAASVESGGRAVFPSALLDDR